MSTIGYKIGAQIDARGKGGPKGRALALILAAADREADRKLSGGLDISPSNLCTGCFLYRAVSGACGC